MKVNLDVDVDQVVETFSLILIDWDGAQCTGCFYLYSNIGWYMRGVGLWCELGGFGLDAVERIVGMWFSSCSWFFPALLFRRRGD